jgi:hypothetical protein
MTERGLVAKRYREYCKRLLEREELNRPGDPGLLLYRDYFFASAVAGLISSADFCSESIAFASSW